MSFNTKRRSLEILILFVALLGPAPATARQGGGGSSEHPASYNVQKHIFHATVDHYSFRPTDPKTFPLRYYVNEDHYNSRTTGPCFFYAGNEADIWQFVNNSGFLFEAAEEFGALVVFAEHRYYGESQVSSDWSYLTVEQAMADFNTLNVHIRKNWNMTSAFIVFGGSYGANLAMWLRLKNPNLWAGAIASSATPLKHILRETNGFARIETEAYGNVSSHCPELVREGWKDLFEEAKTAKGRQKIGEELGLCRPLPDSDAAHDVHGWVGGALETLVQYGYPYPTSFYNPVPAYPFKVACHKMLSSGRGLGALQAAVAVFYNHTGQAGPCFDFDLIVQEAARHWNQRGDHNQILAQRQRLEQHGRGTSITIATKEQRQLSSPTDPGDGDAWGYQTCTEVYQPMPTNGISDFELPYSPNKTAYYESCWRRYHVQPRPDWEELTFMGSDIGTGSNIFLTNGQLDPWRAAGIQEKPSGAPDSIIVRTIENGAHHLDLRAAHPLDPPSVIAVRQEQRAAICEWISEWKETHPVEKGS